MPAGLVAKAKKEGRLNVIALPPDWANYGAIIDAFKKQYGLTVNSENPNGSSAQELQALRSLKGQARAPDAVDVGPSFAVQGAQEGLFAPYKVATWNDIPADMKDASGLWFGDYFGVIALAANRSVVKTMPRELGRPEEARIQGHGLAQRRPDGSGGGVRRRLCRVAGQRRQPR